MSTVAKGCFASPRKAASSLPAIAKAKVESPSSLCVIAELTPSTRPQRSSSGPPELPRAMLAVWSSTLTPLSWLSPANPPCERTVDWGLMKSSAELAVATSTLPV